VTVGAAAALAGDRACGCEDADDIALLDPH
jgi:hypothetical protein